MDVLPIKQVIWVGSSHKDVCAFPDSVKDHVGYALYVAQQGGRHRDVKTLSGFSSAGVIEVITDHRSDTYRTVYTLRHAGQVFVLHAFQKKSKTGSETPTHEIELVHRRLREAEQIAKEMNR